MTDKKQEIKQSSNSFSKMEEEVLDFWDKNKIFEKSVEKKAPKGDYVFYDGPPFATGTPHYGHIVASTMKDIVPRYWTMKGYRVERKWGWDCHGLPIENIVEKEMGSKSKKDIEKMGVEKFNELCRSKVLGYVDEWEKVIRRLGRWADMKNAYKTMDLEFMESVWWVFKELWDKGLIYPGYRSMHICPRCETTLSQQEVAEGYKDIKDLSATVKFQLKSGQKIGNFVTDDKTYILAWTTTPWTLIGNSALAVGGRIDYALVEVRENKFEDLGEKETPPSLVSAKIEHFIVAKERVGLFFGDKIYKVLKEFKGKELMRLEYKPLFGYYVENDFIVPEEAQPVRNGWKIYDAEFVNVVEGTGVVHIAPAFGEDDMNLAKEYNLPLIKHVGMDGIIEKKAEDFAGMSISPRAKDDPKEIREIDLKIVKFLGKRIVFDSQKYTHSYPHCWRCETPLINYAAFSWFVAVTQIKDKALKLAKKINWSPAHIKEGRFGNWLSGARDWSISRQRFWASVMPIWICENSSFNKESKQRGKCGHTVVFGSVKELEKMSGEKVTDLHKHIVDKITFKCEKCGGAMRRVPDVLDTWFDSGSMPYAQMHYPFENKKKFEANFPAEFIAEGDDQTRAWFYYLHVLGTAVKGSEAFKNVIVNGIVLAEDGKKMSKRLNNYPDPMEVMNKHGADPLRYYLCSSPVMRADNINFSEKDLGEQTRFLNILFNVLSFYKMFAQGAEIADLEKKDLVNVLDKWIISRLEQTKKIITEKMDNYNLHAVREIPVFINDLSTWYVRRSRDRFKGDDQADKMRALKTLRRVLCDLARVMAPFMPFMAEHIYQELGAEVESVHLEKWPEVKKDWLDEKVLAEMETVRKIVELGLAKRDEAGIKVRQMLGKFSIFNFQFSMNDEYSNLIKDELNVKEVLAEKGQGELKVELDTVLTEVLKLEGLKREIVRLVNNLRKNAGLTIKDKIILSWQSDSELIKKVFSEMEENLKKDTLSEKIVAGDVEAEEVKVNGETVKLDIKKI